MKQNLHIKQQSTYPRGVAGILLFVLCFLPHTFAEAQGSMSFTVTPPLFQLTIAPGQEWKSTIKVVNSNKYEMPVYATVMNFEAKGDAGQGSFIPIVEDDIEFQGHTLGDWIAISDDPTFIGQGESFEIPFSVRIPKDAEPGGHYAAILIGNRPLESEGTVMKISSYVSALVFVNVEGDVVERGEIREFSTEKTFYQTPDATFTLRFQNKGNVHVQPQGHIIITNMWGKERGRIPVNEQTDFGNVLPDTVRKFEFDWSGEANFFEVGRYKAVATVVYGSEGNRQNDHWTTYFWVIPVKPALYVFSGFFLFTFFMVWSIRRYVRRAVEMEKRYMYNRGVQAPAPQQPTPQAPVRKEAPKLQTLTRPLVAGAVDLRSSVSRRQGEGTHDTGEKVGSFGQFFKKYYLFILFLIIVIVAIFAASLYFKEVLVSERDYEFTVIED